MKGQVYKELLQRVIVFLGGSEVKNPPIFQETLVPRLGPEDALEKGIHFSILPQEITWTEEPGELHFMVSQKVDNTE